MNIVCEKCNTVYRFDASKIPPGGKKVKCSNCQHIFMAMPTSEEADLRTLEPDLESAGDYPEMEPGAEAEVESPRGRVESDAGDKRKQRLLLRQDGTRYAVSDLATLQRWIVERRVTREAELSLDGEVWEKVAERMDLLPFFSIVEKSRSKKKGRREVTGESMLPGVHGREKREKPVRPGQDDSSAPGVRVATTLHAAGGDGEGEAAAGLSLDPALEAVTHQAASGAAVNGATAGEAESRQDDRPAPLISMNRVAPPASAPLETVGAGTASSSSAPSGNPAARAIYAVTILVLILGVGYVARNKLGGANPPAVVSSQPVPAADPVSSQPVGPQGDANVGGPNANPPGGEAVPGLPPGGSPDGSAQPPPGGQFENPPVVEHVPAGGQRVVERTEPPQAMNTQPRPESGKPPRGPEHVASVQTPGPSNPALRPTPPPGKTTPPPSDAALARIEPKVDYHPPPAPTGSTAKLLKEGQQAIDHHKFDLAVASLKKATEQAPANAVVHKELARALLNLADENYSKRAEYQQDAVEACRKAVAIKSNYAEAYHLMGVAQMSLNQKSDAIKNLKAALQYGIRGDDATEVRSFLNQLEGDGGSH